VRRPSTLPLAVVLALVAASAAASDLIDEGRQQDDAAERLVHEVLVARLRGDAAGVERGVSAFRGLDVQRDSHGLAATGLTDQVRFLAASVHVTPEARRQALEDLLEDEPDAELETQLEHCLEDDDEIAAEHLLTDDRHNRRAHLVNEAVRPLGVFSGAAFLAAINPILLAGSAADSLATTAVNLWRYDELSTREREALARYYRLVLREPGRHDAEVAEAVREISEKRAKVFCEDTLEIVKTARDDGDLPRARYHVRRAAELPGCAEDAAEEQAEVDDAAATASALDEAARWPVDDVPGPASGAAREAHTALARAAALGDPAAMRVAAERYLALDDDDELAPSAKLATAVALARERHDAAARDALADLAGDDSAVGEHVEALVERPEWDRLDSLSSAENRHTRDVAQYVLLGGTLNHKTAIQAGTQFATSGVQAAQSLGIANAIGIVTRAWSAWRRDPASNQQIIDEGERYLARQPNGADASDVRVRLAKAYERDKNYRRALLHYRSSNNPDPDRIADLEDELADSLLEDATTKGEPDRMVLTAITREYPKSDAAEQAEELLDELPQDDELPLERELLVAHPEVLGPAGFDLEPRLFDGDVDNGELADEGVTLGPGTLRLSLEPEDGDDDVERTETRVLDSESYARAVAAAKTALYDKGLRGDEAEGVSRLERLIPVYIHGAIGESGLSVAPAIKQRPYRSPDRRLYE
jgi:hypothetical protein